MNPGRILSVMVVAFVGLLFIMQITPEIETEIAATTITNTITLSILDLAEWVVPIGAIVGVLLMVFRQFQSRKV
jgi:hypothetical protein